MALKNLLDQTVNIESFTIAENSFGERIKTWTTHISNYDCTIQTTSGNESIINSIYSVRKTHNMYGEVADITNLMRVNDGTNIYDIVYVYEPRGNHMQIALELESPANIGDAEDTP